MDPREGKAAQQPSVHPQPGSVPTFYASLLFLLIARSAAAHLFTDISRETHFGFRRIPRLQSFGSGVKLPGVTRRPIAASWARRQLQPALCRARLAPRQREAAPRNPNGLPQPIF